MCARQLWAANTSPTTWAIAAYVGESKFGTASGRVKQNSKPLYVKYSSGSYSISVGAFGATAATGATYDDYTYPDDLSWVTMAKGDSIKLRSTIYEVIHNIYGYTPYAKIKICVFGSGSFSGSWAPDTN